MQNKVITKAIENAGSIDVDFDISNEGKPNPINIDTLGGYAANEYVRKDELDELSPNSGSIQVNYSVVGSPNEPENPTENMIWVQTEDMNGYVLSKNEPKNPSDGFVWISLGDSSSVAFHTLKIGDVEVDEVLPLSAKQYISNVWVDVAAKIHQGDAWVEFAQELYIFKEGVGLSEGYTGRFTNPESGSEIYIKPEKIVWASKVGSGNNFWIDPKIDVTQYSKLHVELACLETFDNTHSVTIGVGENAPSAILSPGDFIASVPGIAKSDRKIYEVELANVDKSVFIKLAGYATTGEIYNIWLT